MGGDTSSSISLNALDAVPAPVAYWNGLSFPNNTEPPLPSEEHGSLDTHILTVVLRE